nr:NlpC/P60 family protein [Halomonas venusta]
MLGRGFVHGIADCYGLIRDYYAERHSITLPEYPRSWEWWRNGQDLYCDGFAAAGFRLIEQSEARPGDMWLAQLRSPVPSHGGIVLERGLVLHHPCGKLPVDPSRLSVREPIGRWLPYITHWCRHSELD